MSIFMVYGGAGQLGQVICTAFAGQQDWTVISVDFRESPTATESIIINGTMADDVPTIINQLRGRQLQGIFVVAGGWAGGSIDEVSVLDSTAKMHNFNVISSLVASHVAARSLAPNGILQLTGALAALGPTPGMIGYGMAKAAVHQLISSLADPASKLPDGTTVVGVAPVTLDTPQNRAGMPKADFTSWTPLQTMADKFVEWASGTGRPANGAILSVVTKDGKTTWQPVA